MSCQEDSASPADGAPGLPSTRDLLHHQLTHTGDDDDASSSSSTPLAKAACRAARTSNLTVLSAFLDHLKTAHAPVDAVVEAAVAAAEVRDSRYPEQQQEVVKRLLVSARMQDSASIQAALQEQFPEGREAGALFARVFMDVMLEAAAKVEDAKAQKQAMQHLFTATMASAKAQAAAKEAQKQ